jgi:hypothetical protein
MRFTARLVGVLIATAACIHGDTGRIVRIPTPNVARCINAKTDEITMTLCYVKTQKTTGFFTDDHRAGVTVIATLNSDGNPKAQNPSVNLVSIQDAPAGQVYLPLEYPIASLLPLSSGGSSTKNILLEVYMDKVRGRNSFGDVLDFAGTLLAKLPIPANPYTNAVSQVVGYATAAITKATTDNGGQLLASITLQFNDRDENVDQCKADDFQSTGAIGVIRPEGAEGATLLLLDRLNSDYCWTSVADNTYEIQYAPKPATGCANLAPTAYKDVPNDYMMIVLGANKVIPSADVQKMFLEGLRRGPGTSVFMQRQYDLREAAKLCDALKLNHIYCGAP